MHAIITMIQKSAMALRADKFNELKTTEKLDGILALDNRGYCYYSNDSFPGRNYELHSLAQLREFFFPGDAKQAVVTIEGSETISTVQETADGDYVVLRHKKPSNETAQP